MSIGRSMLALSVLINSSVSNNGFADFFVGISKMEPIFHLHLESSVMALENSHPEKQFTLLLVKLAKANVIAVDSRQPSTEIAQDVRQRLLRLVEARRYVIIPLYFQNQQWSFFQGQSRDAFGGVLHICRCNLMHAVWRLGRTRFYPYCRVDILLDYLISPIYLRPSLASLLI